MKLNQTKMINNSQHIITALSDLLEIQKDFLEKISLENYTQKIRSLGNSTIGNHTRHIIEFFEIAISGYDLGMINYDHRNRNEYIENEPNFAVLKIEEILKNAEKPNKNLKLQQDFFGKNLEIETTFHRELLYNIEHCIHHQALIKVAILELGLKDLVDENYGIAHSTVKHKELCAR